jgi:hypothetical protein
MKHKQEFRGSVQYLYKWWFLEANALLEAFININTFPLKVKVKSLCYFLTEHHAMKAYWGVEV